MEMRAASSAQRGSGVGISDCQQLQVDLKCSSRNGKTRRCTLPRHSRLTSRSECWWHAGYEWAAIEDRGKRTKGIRAWLLTKLARKEKLSSTMSWKLNFVTSNVWRQLSMTSVTFLLIVSQTERRKPHEAHSTEWQKEVSKPRALQNMQFTYCAGWGFGSSLILKHKKKKKRKKKCAQLRAERTQKWGNQHKRHVNIATKSKRVIQVEYEWHQDDDDDHGNRVNK